MKPSRVFRAWTAECEHPPQSGKEFDLGFPSLPTCDLVLDFCRAPQEWHGSPWRRCAQGIGS